MVPGLASGRGAGTGIFRCWPRPVCPMNPAPQRGTVILACSSLSLGSSPYGSSPRKLPAQGSPTCHVPLALWALPCYGLSRNALPLFSRLKHHRLWSSAPGPAHPRGVRAPAPAPPSQRCARSTASRPGRLPASLPPLNTRPWRLRDMCRASTVQWDGTQ